MNRYLWLDEYLLSKPGVEKDFKMEWQWWRYQIRGKLFAALLSTGETSQTEYTGKELLSLKCDPALAELYRKQYTEVLPGYYMDKRCWNSIDLNGSLSDALIRQMIDDSYQLVFEKLTKKAQREILQKEQ